MCVVNPKWIIYCCAKFVRFRIKDEKKENTHKRILVKVRNFEFRQIHKQAHENDVQFCIKNSYMLFVSKNGIHIIYQTI